MTTAEKVIKNKMGLIKLAEQLGNVSQACKIMGYSRDSFYRFKELYDEQGEEGLREISRRKPNRKNRVDPAVEEAVLAITLENPALGQLRVSNTLKQDGIFVSPGGVRSIWLRHNLETFKKRLKALEEKAAAENLVLTEAQLQAMEKAKEQREAQGEIETQHPGYLGAQDTYYVGTIKGIGRIYQQTFIDTYTKIGFAKLYTSKHAITAADLLNDRVLPWYEERLVRLLRILTDRGTEYNGLIENHEYQLYLAIEDIDHSKTKAQHPQTNGICERFHRTIKEEFYDIAFRKKIYSSLDELQTDLDQWMAYYNAERPHSGKYCNGRTPDQTFSDTKHLADEKMVDTLFPKEVAQQDPSSFALAA
jgi:transposase InsO family protein